MSTFLVTCPSCNTRCTLSQHLIGRTVACARCGKMFRSYARGFKRLRVDEGTAIASSDALPRTASHNLPECRTARVSMVLGILSWAGLGCFTAVPAILAGLAALREIRACGGRLTGESQALMGIRGAVSFLVMIALVFGLVAVVLPSLSPLDRVSLVQMESAGGRGIEVNFREQVKAWTMARDELAGNVSRLQDERRDLICMLERMGVRSAEDLRGGDPRATTRASELVALDRQIEALKRHQLAYDLAVTSAESILRRMDREQMMKSLCRREQELGRFLRAALDIGETLRDHRPSSAPDLELEAGLEQVLRYR